MIKTEKTIVYLQTFKEIESIIGKEKLNEIVENILDEKTFNGVYVPYKDYIDYDYLCEVLSEQILKMGVYDIRNKTYAEIYDKLNVWHDEIYWDIECEMENELTGDLVSSIENCLPDNHYVDMDIWEMMDIFYDHGYVFDAEFEKDLRDAKLNVNLMLGYKKEGDWSFTCAPEIFGELSGYYTGLKCETMLEIHDEKIFNNSMLMYVLYQQGYTLKDLIEHKLRFPKELYYDLESLPTGVGAFTISIKIPAIDLIWLLSKDCNENFKLMPGISITQFDPYNGSGGCGDIELDKPLVISSDMIYAFQIETGHSKENMGWLLDSVYGMCGSFWGDDFWRFTNEKPMSDYVINFDEAVDALTKQLKETGRI